MTELRYTVAIQDAGFIGQWLDLAAFRWFNDAKHHALRTSKADKLGRYVRITPHDDREPFYFQHGHNADHTFEEAA